MPPLSNLIVFSGAALVLLLIPGPAVLYIVARSANQGVRAGLLSVAGVHTGTIVHVLAAVLGLSAVIVASATAFTTVKLVGAGYLIWLGIASLLNRRRATAIATPRRELETRSSKRIFTDAVVLNIFNPKTAVFFLAFVPQFVDLDAGNTTSQLLVLSAVFIGLGIISDGAYAIAGGWVGGRLSNSPTVARRKDVVTGTIYIGLGLATALSGNHLRSDGVE